MTAMKSSNFKNDINNDSDLDEDEMLNFNNDNFDDGDGGGGNLISKLKLQEKEFNDFDMDRWWDLNEVKEKINSEPPTVKLRRRQPKGGDNVEPLLNNNAAKITMMTMHRVQ